MKASELRIGNFVVPPETPFEPIIINLDGLQYYGDDLIPVKPTEQFLLNLGFEKDFEGDFMMQWRGVTFYYRLSDFSFRRDFNVKTKLNVIPIEYIHQLQNLYFALTGEELLKQ